MTYHSPGRVQFLAQGGDGVDRLGRLFLGLFFVLVLDGLDVTAGLVLDVEGGFLGGLARLGVGSLDLVQVLVRALDDVELVVDRLVGLDGVVQVLVRHGGCFFLDTWGGTCEKGRR